VALPVKTALIRYTSYRAENAGIRLSPAAIVTLAVSFVSAMWILQEVISYPVGIV
jgi:hypothetical protein